MAAPAPVEETGLGSSMPIEDSLPTSKVWAVLLDKIQHPDKFLPVNDIVTRPIEGGTYREMSMTVAGKANRIVEHIFANEAEGTVVFINVGDLNADSEHVNRITDGPAGRALEFYSRKRSTKASSSLSKCFEFYSRKRSTLAGSCLS